jgi:hypothetical protein
MPVGPKVVRTCAQVTVIPADRSPMDPEQRDGSIRAFDIFFVNNLTHK